MFESPSQLSIYLSSPKSNQHQFSPNNMNAQLKEKVLIINIMGDELLLNYGVKF